MENYIKTELNIGVGYDPLILQIAWEMLKETVTGGIEIRVSSVGLLRLYKELAVGLDKTEDEIKEIVKSKNNNKQ